MRADWQRKERVPGDIFLRSALELSLVLRHGSIFIRLRAALNLAMIESLTESVEVHADRI